MDSQTRFRTGITRKRAFLRIAGIAVLAAFLCIGCGNKNPGGGGGPDDKKGDTYFITFDPNGGEPLDFAGDTTKNGKLASLPTPEYDGHDFNGWFTTADTNGTKVDTNYVFTKNTTVYAHWTKKSTTGGDTDTTGTDTTGTDTTDVDTTQTPDTYIIEFDANGGTVETQNRETGANGKLASLPTPNFTGYKFEGWYTAAEGGTKVDTSKVYSADDTIYAQWTIIGYKVTFNSRGGSAVDAQSIEHDGTIEEPDKPTHPDDAQNFAGWYEDSTFTGEEWDFATPVTEDITLYARWTTLKVYDVTFDTKIDGSTHTIQQVIEGDHATNHAATRTGYTLEGWYKNSDLTPASKWNFAADVVTENVTLYANWTIKTYNITYVYNDGTPPTTANLTSYTVTTPAFTLHNPTKTGYTFAGWTGTGITGTQITVNVAVGDTGVKTYTANWTPVKYSVTFDSKGGSAITAQSIDYNTVAALPTPAPTLANYTFAGWYKEETYATEWVFATDVVTAATTLYANWTPVKYSVTFDSKGGSAVTEQSIDYNTKAAAPTPAPTRAGYTLAGWYKEETYTTAWAFATDVVTAATTLYAKWEIIPYTITCDLAGGTGAPTTISYNVEDLTFTLTQPTKYGFDFLGWTGYNGSTPQKTVRIDKESTGDRTYTANWDVSRYTVDFRAYYIEWFDDDVDPIHESQTVTHGDKLTKPATDPTRIGYTFDGWYRETPFAQGGQVTPWNFAVDVVTSETTIYAKWNPIPYNITYVNCDDPVENDNPITYNYGTQTFKLTNPTKEGSTFVGWTESYEDGTPDKDWGMAAEIAIRSTGNKTFTANWESNAYVFEGNTGNYPDSRDGKSYKWVRIGTQIWMAENLNYTPTNTTSYSRCYDDISTNCNKYGRLYTWNAAMDGMAAATTANPIVQGACPVGWHVPNDDEWTTLTNYVGSNPAAKLSSKTGWEGENGWSDWTGTDPYGFNALPGGRNSSANNPATKSSDGASFSGYWWTSREANNSAYYRKMEYDEINEEMNLTSGSLEKGYSFSVRCVADGN